MIRPHKVLVFEHLKQVGCAASASGVHCGDEYKHAAVCLSIFCGVSQEMSFG
jgi:hypothetical protein